MDREKEVIEENIHQDYIICFFFPVVTITSQFNTAFFKSKFPALVACISLYFKLQVYLETVKKEGKKPKSIYILSSVKSVVAQHCKMN